MGQGAFGVGTIWKARELVSDRAVRIKIINASIIGPNRNLSLFTHGVEAIKKLNEAPGKPPSLVKMLNCEPGFLGLQHALLWRRCIDQY